jgi:molybdopterin-containing oxidoreductase family iron-sulfur binding subunit
MNPRKDLSGALAALQERVGGAQGKKYWRTLEELADTEAFQELISLEFPDQADIWPSALSRRQFLTLMGASLALAGLGGCSVRPAAPTNIVPYVHPPEQIVPGKPLFYATAMTLAGCGVGLLVESHLGRPTKIEGNPEHPASLGATDAFHQASVLTLYDPDRSKTVTHLGQTRTWEEAVRVMRDAIEKQRPKRGAGVRILSEAIVSPTLAQQVDDFLKEYPQAKWHQYEPIGREASRQAAMQAFGEPVNTYHDFTKADVVLSLDADFLGCGAGHLRNVADFMSRRRVRTSAEAAQRAEMNRLYVVETAVSSTGAKADHRLALRAAEVEGFGRAIGEKVGINPQGSKTRPGAWNEKHEPWIAAVARDLEQHRGRCVVLAGDRQPAAVHLLAHALNDRLGNIGKTVFHTAPIAARPVDFTASLKELLDDADAGHVELLLILATNPVFTAPADFNFTDRIQKIPLRVHLGLHEDETALQCHWHLPETHFLEAWSDTRTFDGTATIMQPLIQPLYENRSVHEVLQVVTHGLEKPGYEIVRDYWRKHQASGGRPSPGASADFEQFWQTAVHDGIVPNTKLPAKSVSLKGGWEKHLSKEPRTPVSGRGEYELVFQPDPTIYDGRFANNGWLQELPKPITKLTWDNAAIMSPATAKELGVGLGAYAHGGEHGGSRPDVVELQLGDGSVKAPIWIMPGHADGSITVCLGYGRERAGKVGGTDGKTVGFNAYRLRTSEQPWFASGLKVTKTGERYLVACTQQHQLMENRESVRSATLKEYQQNPNFLETREPEAAREATEQQVPAPRTNLQPNRERRPLTLYPPFPYEHHKWGMAIDLTTCTGCNACVVACQAENNIPVVGKNQVAAGREMHWLRIDRYNAGPYERPTEFHFQPLPCMHCENAPCEYVCPVEATVHSADGLNEMIYQRCVGTRFCSNNCPYKVRRFNFFTYADYASKQLQMQYNPDVTVRSRGVMEKCTYCVQRIRHAGIDAQAENRPIADGEILTACQAACPAQAIVFGDLNDAKSTVKQWKDSPLNYSLLEEVNTNPRTTYLAALRNPNPELEAE